MQILGFAILIGLIAGAILWGLSVHWSHTPHGRIKPIFALAFKLLPILNPSAHGRAIGAEKMDSPDEIARARAAFRKSTMPLSKPVPFDGMIEDRLIPDAPGGELAIRTYRPSGPGPFPLVVYFHGGGFVVGSPDYTDGVTRTLALETPAVVVSVDYRLAPEHPLPAPVEDCAFAVDWCYENAEELGAQPGPLAVAGDSAGGNLSAVVARRDRDAGRDRIALQVLIYPVVDVTRLDRESQVAFGEGYGLSLLDLEDCMRHYLPPGTDRANPDVSPLHTKSLAGLPRTYVITAGFDVLRDEGIEYADALEKAGVDVTYLNEPTLPHGFITMTRICSEAEETLRSIASEIARLAERPDPEHSKPDPA